MKTTMTEDKCVDRCKPNTQLGGADRHCSDGSNDSSVATLATPVAAERQLALLERIAFALQTIARVGRIEPPPEASTATAATILDDHVPSDAKTNQQQAVAGGDDVRQELAEIRRLLRRQTCAADTVNRVSYPVEEAADITGYSPWTIRRACATGRLRAEKSPDGRWRIPHDQVAAIQDRGLPK